MVQITVSDELARAITEAAAPVVLIDSCGRTVGQISPMDDSERPHGMTKERSEEIKRRMREPGTYVSFQEIKKRLGW